LSNITTTRRTDDSGNLDEDEDERTSSREEEKEEEREENSEDDDEVDDCESVFSAVESDDASNTDKGTPFLDVLVDAFVEVILERYAAISRMEDTENGPANEQQFTSCDGDEILSTSTEDIEPRQCRKRKANQGNDDDCDERRHSRARSE
jgi:hypothetical protein